MNLPEDVELTYDNVIEQAWYLLGLVEYDVSDISGMSLLVQTHIWLAEEIRVRDEKIPVQVRNLLDAYKNEMSGKRVEEWPATTTTD